MDPRTTTWPTYKWPRNIDNLNTPWVPSPDSFTGALPDAHNTVQARPAPQQSYEPPKTVLGRKIGTLMRVLCLLKPRQVEQPKEPVFQPVAWDTLKFDEVPLSKWRAFGAYSRPVVNHVEVHNTFTPSPTPYRTMALKDVNPEEVFQSLRSPGGGFHPENWVRGLQHPSLPPPPTEWPLPRPGDPLPFPWECHLNRYLKRAASGSAPLHWNIHTRAFLYGGPNDITIPLLSTDLAEPSTFPLITHMYISAVACTNIDFPWKFMVVNATGIRVRDVLDAIIDNFQCYVFRGEYERWPEARQKRAELEWRLRGGEAERDGLRRLDYLCGQHYFRGLEPNPDRTGWTLYVGSDW